MNKNCFFFSLATDFFCNKTVMSNDNEQPFAVPFTFNRNPTPRTPNDANNSNDNNETPLETYRKIQQREREMLNQIALVEGKIYDLETSYNLVRAAARRPNFQFFTTAARSGACVRTRNVFSPKVSKTFPLDGSCPTPPGGASSRPTAFFPAPARKMSTPKTTRLVALSNKGVPNLVHNRIHFVCSVALARAKQHTKKRDRCAQTAFTFSQRLERCRR